MYVCVCVHACSLTHTGIHLCENHHTHEYKICPHDINIHPHSHSCIHTHSCTPMNPEPHFIPVLHKHPAYSHRRREGQKKRKKRQKKKEVPSICDLASGAGGPDYIFSLSIVFLDRNQLELFYFVDFSSCQSGIYWISGIASALVIDFVCFSLCLFIGKYYFLILFSFPNSFDHIISRFPWREGAV